jgi:hypothetical protein
MQIKDLPGAIGTGVLAGVAGTAAMTVSSTVEARLRGRPNSTAPADAAGKVLGIAGFRTPAARDAPSGAVAPVHEGREAVARGVLRSAGMGPASATAGHMAGVWGSEQVMLPALSVAPPITMWGRREIAIDGFHHLVYVLGTAAGYELLARRAGSGRRNGRERRGAALRRR